MGILNFINRTNDVNSSGWKAAYSKSGPLDLKRLKVKSNDECPKDCKPTVRPGDEDFGCVTLCDKCLEASMPGNIGFGFGVADKLGGTIGEAVAKYISRKFAKEEQAAGKDDPRDLAAIGVGRCIADAVDGPLPLPEGDKKVDKDILCKCIKMHLNQLHSCDCAACSQQGAYPKPRVKRTRGWKNFGGWGNDLYYGVISTSIEHEQEE